LDISERTDYLLSEVDNVSHFQTAINDAWNDNGSEKVANLTEKEANLTLDNDLGQRYSPTIEGTVSPQTDSPSSLISVILKSSSRINSKQNSLSSTRNSSHDSRHDSKPRLSKLNLHGITEGTDDQETEKPKHLFLIVDDSNLNRKMMSKLLVAQGHLFELAEDG
jgi:hypothetical protein